jgi:diacylglycerol kinase
LVQKKQSIIDAFKNAFHGVHFVVSTQRNARIHMLLTAIAILVSWFFNISLLEWAAIIIVIGMVWLSECLNTSIEKLTDLASPEFHILAKHAKDSAAAAVLMASITAAVVGLIIFLPKLWMLIR